MAIANETPRTSRGLSFFIIACTLLVVGFGVGAPTAALPAIFQDFGLSYMIVGTMSAGFLLLLMLFLALGGRLRALIGDKPLLLTSMSVFIGGALLEGLAPDFLVWMIGRLLQGAATGCLLSISLGFAVDNARRQWRVDVIGVLLALYFLGNFVGPALGSHFHDVYGWRNIAFVCAALGLLVLILQALFVKVPMKTEIDAIFD